MMGEHVMDNRINSLLDKWEAEGHIEAVELEEISSHLNQCTECRNRYGSLISFMRKDLGWNQSDHPPKDFTDRVMMRVAELSTHRARTYRNLSRHRKVLLPLAAAAAVVVLFISITVLSSLFGRQNLITVRFTLHEPGATSVFLVGDFTDWNPEELMLSDKNSDGRWEIEVMLTKGKAYLYNFIIDGELWVPDPTAPAQIDDGFGGKNSLLQL